MSDQPPPAAANAAAAAAAVAAVLRCGCGLVLQDPITGLLRTVPGEAQNGRCLYCFPLPTQGDIAEMRRLQVEEFRIRVETARNRGHSSSGGIPTTDAAAVAAAAAATTARTQTAATAAAPTQCQAMPVTPEQDVADGRQRNGDEVDVFAPVTARTIDTQADQDQAQARPRALLKDSGDGHNNGTGQGASASATTEEASASAGDTHSIGGNDTFAMAASTTPGPTVAAALPASGASPASGAPDGSLLSVVAMFKAQEREEDYYGSDEGGGIEDIITECKRDSNGDRVGERGECANDNHQQEHLCHETADGKRKVPPTEEGLCAQNSSAASAPALPVEDPCDDSEGSPRKKICSGSAHTDPLAESSTNCLISREAAREIENCVKEGTKDSISLAKRDRCIEQLRLRIEGEEESTGMKAAYANTMISLEAPRMIVSALKRITASYAGCKKAKAKNAHARWSSECCHTLATIAYHGRAQSVVDSGAVTVAVLSALKLNSIRNLKLCLHGIEALQTLCSVSRATEEVLENEGLSIISATLSHLQKKESTKSSRDSKHAVRMIMKLLDNMSSSSQLLTPTAKDQEDAARARMIGQHGLLKPILDMICEFPDEVELQLALCGALSSLSADEHNCNVIVELGGLRALVFLSDRHPLRSEMQKTVADCYAWLVADQKNIQLEACKDGVVEACIRLLQNRCHDNSVVRSSLNVLDSICESKECHDYLISANTVSAVTVVAAEAAYSNENDIQLLCQSFLCRLRRDAGASAET